MKREVLKAVSIRGTQALAWMVVFVAAMSFMTAYVARPVLDEWLSLATGWLLSVGDLSSFAVIASALIAVCFVLPYQMASVIVGHLFGGPTIRLEN